mgnify:FL=1
MWAKGGRGGAKLAQAIEAAAKEPAKFRYLYPATKTLVDKITILAKEMYGAASVELSDTARKQLADLEKLGYGKLPVCMAKTHLSISHDPKLKGAPSGYAFPVREVKVSAGAGFVYVLAGEMRTMPGLGSRPAYLDIDIDAKGNIVGLF